MNPHQVAATVLTMLTLALSVPSCTPIHIARDGVAEAQWRNCVARGFRSEAGILRCVRKASLRQSP